MTDFTTCTCIRLNCWHEYGKCDEPPTIRGGICNTCRFFKPEPKPDKTWLRGDWMQTYTGKRFYPMDPRVEDIDARDIAHALSFLCRYGGHVDEFYSVAEHCVLMSRAVEPQYALAALLHDATEAYVVDVPRPLKRYLPAYREIEGRVWAVIAEKFGIDPVLPDAVHEADNRILVNETAAFMPRREAWESLGGLEPLPISLAGWAPFRAKMEYIGRLGELGFEVKR